MMEGKIYTPPAPVQWKPLPPPPKVIAAVPRLQKDIEALAELFSQQLSTQVLVQASRVYTILYGFADASGLGFGSTVMLEGGIRYRVGTWPSDNKDNSSNYQEFEKCGGCSPRRRRSWKLG
jgi:hypothetical protein